MVVQVSCSICEVPAVGLTDLPDHKVLLTSFLCQLVRPVASRLGDLGSERKLLTFARLW